MRVAILADEILLFSCQGTGDTKEVSENFGGGAMLTLYYDGCGGVDRDRTDDLRLAKPALSQLSYDPGLPRVRTLVWGPDSMWARADLNCRPHAYQACALTT